MGLNLFLTFEPGKHDAFDDRLIPQILDGEQRKRARKPNDARRAVLTLRMIVANALKAVFVAPSHRVYYTRHNTAYSNNLQGIYVPEFIGTKMLLSLIDWMAEAGWLTTKVGIKPKPVIYLGGAFSTFAATEQLLRACEHDGISHTNVVLSEEAPELILRNRLKRPVVYNPKDHRRTIGAIRACNKFIKQFRIELDVHDEEWKRIVEEIRNSKDKDVNETRNLVPDRSAVRLRRIFNNEDWRQGGRFYGGWWQYIPSKWRHRIRIDHHKTVELDFSGFLTRAIYHSKKLQLDGDPYEVPKIREITDKRGVPWPGVRDKIKLATNILINAGPGVGIEWVEELVAPPGLSKRSMFKLIEAHHAPIAEAFRSGEGLRMMYRESTICQKVLTAGIHDRILVLPIHDSYITEDRHADWLHRQMVSAYRDEFGFAPSIRPKEVDLKPN